MEEITFKEIEKIANKLNSKDKNWHHHMLFPKCVLNKQPGKWNIVFEDPETKQITEVIYDHEPKEDLRKIEVLYYSQNK